MTLNHNEPNDKCCFALQSCVCVCVCLLSGVVVKYNDKRTYLQLIRLFLIFFFLHSIIWNVSGYVFIKIKWVISSLETIASTER